jgi:hypothetical protein
MEMSATQPLGRTPQQLPPGLSEEQAKRENWTFQPGADHWTPPEGYHPESVCRDIWTKNLNSEQIQSMRKRRYFSLAGDDGKYYAFSPQEFCDHQTPSERPRAEAFLRKNNIRVTSV